MLRELADLWIDPLFLFFFFFLLAWLMQFYSKRKSRIFMVTVCVIFYLLFTPWSSSFLLRNLEVYPPLTFEEGGKSDIKNLEEVRKYDAVVVLAGKAGFSYAYGYRQLGDETVRRVLYGIYLNKKMHVPLLFSGGRLPWMKDSLAVMMDKFLWDHEQTYARWLEGKSLSTDENAKYTWSILAPLGKTRIVLVTDAWHMRRAVMSFEHYGFKVLPASVGYHFANKEDKSFRRFLPSYDAVDNIYFWFHELLGRAYYYLHYRYNYTNRKEIH